MSGRKTTEITEKSRICFHPHNCRNWILKEYNQRLEACLPVGRDLKVK